MSEKPPPESRNESGSASAAAVRSTLVKAMASVVRRLGERAPPRIATDDLCRELTAALSAAPWPGPGFRVRRDRLRGDAGVGGAWRFDVLIERPDGVVAAIDVRGDECDAGQRAETLSRLSLARARGIAETAFLFGADRAGANVDTSPTPAPGEPDLVSASLLATAELETPALSGWVLALWEVPPAARPDSG